MVKKLGNGEVERMIPNEHRKIVKTLEKGFRRKQKRREKYRETLRREH